MDFPPRSTSTSNASAASNSDAPFPSTTMNRIMQASKKRKKCTLATPTSNSSAAASLILKWWRFTPTDDARADQRNDFSSPAGTDAHARVQLTMPQHINLHDAGLCQSPHLKELGDNRQTNVKNHNTWASKVTKVVILHSLLDLLFCELCE